MLLLCITAPQQTIQVQVAQDLGMALSKISDSSRPWISQGKIRATAIMGVPGGVKMAADKRGKARIRLRGQRRAAEMVGSSRRARTGAAGPTWTPQMTGTFDDAGVGCWQRAGCIVAAGVPVHP